MKLSSDSWNVIARREIWSGSLEQIKIDAQSVMRSTLVPRRMHDFYQAKEEFFQANRSRVRPEGRIYLGFRDKKVQGTPLPWTGILHPSMTLYVQVEMYVREFKRDPNVRSLRMKNKKIFKNCPCRAVTHRDAPRRTG